MPNNFKLTGNVYVSKAGNDANSGLTPDAPKLTVQAGLNTLTSGQTLIIGAGVYNEPNISRSANLSYVVIGDGQVVLDGSTFGEFSIILGANSNFVDFFNITFRNYKFIRRSENAADISGRLTFTNCVVYNTNLFADVGSQFGGASIIRPFFLIKTLLVNVGLSATVIPIYNVGRFYFYDSTLINCAQIARPTATSNVNSTTSLNSILTFINSYSDSNTYLNIDANTAASNFNFNNIQGKIIMNTNGAVSGVNSNGVALSFAQHRIDYPTFNVNSFSSDPKFNNPTLLDFTLQAGSPNVSASSNFSSNIGGTEYAVSYTASSAAFTTNAISQSLDYRGIYYGISGSAVSGSITSGPMFLQWPRTKPLTAVNWIGALDFNKSISASFSGNTNVPAYTTFTSASLLAGANPDRLKIRMRFSTQQTQPSTDAEWDNNGYWPAGTYQLFEPNTKPKIDYKGTGNGDPTYAETSAIGDLVPSWIQTEIILRNDYNR